MSKPAPKRRPLMAGARLAGESEYQVTIYGNPESELPPVRTRMSLGELRRWLSHSGRTRPAAARQLPLLRLLD